MNKSTPVLEPVANYYSEKIKMHGLTPQGVDWNGEAGQITRFEQLAKVLPENRNKSFSLNDLGCGYGALYGFLNRHYTNFSYTGIDVSPEMAEAARTITKHDPKARIALGYAPPDPSEFGIASGIFNVRLEQSNQSWQSYIEKTLDMLNASSSLGFSVNFLTSYSDDDKKRPDLYYADPLALFDYCKNKYSRNVALLHDYDLFEFTLLVRKS